jgi:Tfp pilus assembly protein FimV
MSQKRNYKPRTYTPAVIQPVVTDEPDFIEPEPTQPVFVEIVVTDTHTVAEGENIQSVAAKYLPAGMTRQNYARRLYELNGDFFAGKVVRL